MQINQIPIINYHKISPLYDIGITTRHPKRFENDLKILKKYQFNTITFKDLINSQAEISNKGIIYPVTNFIGGYNDWDVQVGKFKFKHLDWQELKEIKELGFEIGSHTQSHELLTGMSYQQQFKELSESKKELQDTLGVEVYSISYPFGRFNQETIRCTEEAGYKYGLASIYFKNIEEKKSSYALRRFNIYRFDTSEQFELKIGIRNSNYVFYRDWLIQKGGLGTTLLQSIRKYVHRNGRLKVEIK